MGVLNALIALSDYTAEFDVAAERAARILVSGPVGTAGFDYTNALDIARRFPTLLLRGEDHSSRLRQLVCEWIKCLRPSWGPLIPNGRNYLSAYLSRNEKQCFETAGLFDSPITDQIHQWWTDIALFYRSVRANELEAVGRIGEERTMRYETDRLVQLGRPDLVPTWMSVEDNTLGYDVRSYKVSQEGVSPLNIEVKSTRFLPVSFFLTKNEWKRASSAPDLHIFYVWYLPQDRLIEIRPDQLRPSIPVDIGGGNWESARFICDAVFEAANVR